MLAEITSKESKGGGGGFRVGGLDRNKHNIESAIQDKLPKERRQIKQKNLLRPPSL